MTDEQIIKNIVEQKNLCKVLMDSLYDDIKNFKPDRVWNDGHTVIQSDIIRLRRELNKLNKMFERVSGYGQS